MRDNGWLTSGGRACLLLLWAIGGILLPRQGFALDPAKSLHQFNCQTWKRQSGLLADGVNAILQAQDGYLWLGTARGLVRFDGSEFRLFDLASLPHARSTVVTSLSSARHGGFWFGLQRGSFGYCDGETLSARGKEEWGGSRLNVHQVLEDTGGDVWIASETLGGRLTTAGAFEILLQRIPGPPGPYYNVTSLYADSRNRIWLGTARRGLLYWENGAFKELPDPALRELAIRCLAEDRQGRLWVGTEWGLLCYDSELRRLPRPFPWCPTQALLVDRQGVLWVGTGGNGLVRFVDGTQSVLTQADGLADDLVTALAEDKEGSLWVGTRNGLSQLSDVKFPTFGKREGLAADINVAVCASRRGGLWVATGQGFTYFDGKARVYGPEVGLKNLFIIGIHEARNEDVYLTTGGMDVEVFSGGRIVASHPCRTWPGALTEDAQSVVTAVGGDLYRVTPKSFTPYPFRDGKKPPIDWIWHLICARDGALWVASNQGICRVQDGEYTLWTTKDGLSDNRVNWLVEDADGVIWAGMETGLARLKDGRVRCVSERDGLFDDLIRAMVPDDAGHLWVDSGEGFFRVGRDRLNAFADGTAQRVVCTPFTGLDSVKSAEKNLQKPSGCKTLDGRIWFPTAQGVVRIDPTNVPANPVPPQVHLQSVRANGQSYSPAAPIVLPPGYSELEFPYTGVSFLAPASVRYRHRLLGYESDWVLAGSRRAAFYANLQPGAYRFEVQACNEDGLWDVAGAQCQIRLRPLFHQTPLCRALAGGLAVAGLWVLHRLRVRRLTRRQRQLQREHDELEARVRERTAELGAANEGLQKEIEERRRMESEVAKAHQELLVASRQAGMAEVATGVLHNLGNVLNSVNVSATLLAERVQQSKAESVGRVAALLHTHGGDLADFLRMDPKGKQLPRYLSLLAQRLESENRHLREELHNLRKNVEHMNRIVSLQQGFARVASVLEWVPPRELLEEALRLQAHAFRHAGVTLERDYEQTPPLHTDRHKVLQILVNLLENARAACLAGQQPEKRVVVRLAPIPGQRVRLEVHDNGVGISAEDLTRIFRYGYTTRPDGHGFGLHSGALAARELGGSLTAQSQGLGRGAIFTLELPLPPAS